ncbi:response regulator [Marichromatium gracile]|uniref:Two-component system response regulator n=1 Tax=Marichromatium gracile TaxID=1048 RepID=A0ABR5VF25_MARGR|nr:response regulator [Marichromatium gracile]KXX64318.1 two-component system response regulator [Marichromatium gracile]
MSAGPHCSMLLVEDDPVDLDLILRALTPHIEPDWISVARDGEEVLARVEHWGRGTQPPPQLILLDLKLPGIDGLEVLRRLRSSEPGRLIPVVVLTSSDEPRDIQAAYDLGANSYVVKPINYERFLEGLHQINRYWCCTNRPPS